jgi:hypothetical protein
MAECFSQLSRFRGLGFKIAMQSRTSLLLPETNAKMSLSDFKVSGFHTFLFPHARDQWQNVLSAFQLVGSYWVQGFCALLFPPSRDPTAEYFS